MFTTKTLSNQQDYTLILHICFILLCKLQKQTQQTINEKDFIKEKIKLFERHQLSYNFLNTRQDDFDKLLETHYQLLSSKISALSERSCTGILGPAIIQSSKDHLNNTYGQTIYQPVKYKKRNDLTQTIPPLSLMNIVYLFFNADEIEFLEACLKNAEIDAAKSYVNRSETPLDQKPYQLCSQEITNKMGYYSYLGDAIFNPDKRVVTKLLSQGFTFAYRDETGISVFEQMMLGAYLGPNNFVQIPIDQTGCGTVINLYNAYGQQSITKEYYTEILNDTANITKYYTPKTYKKQPLFIADNIFWLPGVAYTSPLVIAYMAYYWLGGLPNLATTFQQYLLLSIYYTTGSLNENQRYSQQPLPNVNKDLNIAQHAAKYLQSSRPEQYLWLQKTFTTYKFNFLIGTSLAHKNTIELGGQKRDMLPSFTIERYSNSGWHYQIVSEKKEQSGKQILIHFYHQEHFKNNKYQPAIELKVESSLMAYEYSLIVINNKFPSQQKNKTKALKQFILENNSFLFEYDMSKFFSNNITISTANFSKASSNRNIAKDTCELTFSRQNTIDEANYLLNMLNILIPSYMARSLVARYVKPNSTDSEYDLIRETPKDALQIPLPLQAPRPLPISQSEPSVHPHSPSAGDLSPAQKITTRSRNPLAIPFE